MSDGIDTIMDTMLKVRIESDGPESWRLVIKDAETGKWLPIMFDRPITLHEIDGLLVADVTVMIYEVALPDVYAQLTRVDENEVPIAVTVPEAPQETVDDFAARTVSLILEPK